MSSRSELSARGAALFGAIFIAVSVVPALAAVGILPTQPRTDTPSWIGIACGLAFLFAGLILLSDAAAGGLGPGGVLRDDAPGWIRRFQSITGFVIATLLATITSWVAFGRGERHFSSSISVPFVSTSSRGGDTMGRWAFGLAAVMMWCVIGGVLVSAARKSLARHRANRPG